MLQVFNRVVHRDYDKEAPVNKKLTLAVAATAAAGLMALVGAPLLSQSRAASQPTIQGVWRITEITTTGPNASTNRKPPTEPVHLHGKTLQPHSCKRDDGAPRLAGGPAGDGNCCSVVGGVWNWLNSPIRHIRSGRWKTHDAPASCKKYFRDGARRIYHLLLQVGWYDAYNHAGTQCRWASNESDNVDADANRVGYARSWRRTPSGGLSIRGRRTHKTQLIRNFVLTV